LYWNTQSYVIQELFLTTWKHKKYFFLILRSIFNFIHFIIFMIKHNMWHLIQTSSIELFFDHFTRKKICIFIQEVVLCNYEVYMHMIKFYEQDLLTFFQVISHAETEWRIKEDHKPFDLVYPRKPINIYLAEFILHQ
jgi:hypothetical protein